MARWLLRRLGLLMPTLLLVSVLLFVLIEVVPGDVGRTILGPYATPEQVARLKRELGYDRPLAARYVRWLVEFATGRWGESVVLRRPVRELVGERLVHSLQLALVALLAIVPASVACGVLAGLRPGGLLDRVVTVGGLSLAAIPEFTSGVVLLVAFGVQLRWFPTSAEFPAGADLLTRLHHLVLPAAPLGLVLFGYIARMARAGVLDVRQSAYVRTALLKGLPHRVVVLRHILPNALAPTVAVIGSQVGWLVGGLVVTETLFNYPGLGKLIYDAALAHDVPVLEASGLVVAGVFMLSNLAADVGVMLLNPRVRTG